MWFYTAFATGWVKMLIVGCRQKMIVVAEENLVGISLSWSGVYPFLY